MRLQELLLELGIRLTLGALRLAVRSPPIWQRSGLQLLERLVSWCAWPIGVHGRLTEVREVLIEEPVGRTTLRRILQETRPGQLRAVVRGILRATWRPAEVQVPEPPRMVHRSVRRGSGPRPRLLLVGHSPGAALLEQALLEQEAEVTRRPLQADELATWLRPWPKQPAAIWLDEEATADPATWHMLPAQGVPLLLPIAAFSAPNPEAELARSRPTLVQGYHPLAELPAMQHVRRLLRQGVVGELQTIRLQWLGDAAGADPSDGSLLWLLAWLGGELTDVKWYRVPSAPGPGRAALLACTFAAPERYGLLECCPAAVRGPDPWLELEAAGTDGLLWLHGGLVRPPAQPPVELRLGARQLSWGIGSLLDQGQEAAWAGVARQLLRLAHGQPGPDLLSATELAAVVQARARLREQQPEAEETRAGGQAVPVPHVGHSVPCARAAPRP